MTWARGPLLADTSVWARAGDVREPWCEALRAERVVICAVVELELLYSARTRRDVDRLQASVGRLRDLAITRGTLAAAKRALIELAARGADGHHRVPPPDAIIAACAAEHGCAVLHYDRHYDRLAEVLAFESLWAAPAGSL